MILKKFSVFSFLWLPAVRALERKTSEPFHEELSSVLQWSLPTGLLPAIVFAGLQNRHFIYLVTSCWTEITYSYQNCSMNDWYGSCKNVRQDPSATSYASHNFRLAASQSHALRLEHRGCIKCTFTLFLFIFLFCCIYLLNNLTFNAIICIVNASQSFWVLLKYVNTQKW